jgi:predicted nucleic acid-binding protein
MKKLRIYLDTSVINFLFADDATEKRDITRRFFNECVQFKVYEVFISSLVVDEINRTRDEERRGRLLAAIRQYGLSELPLEPWTEIEQLAAQYCRLKIVPPRKEDDALHVAIATVHLVDVVLSWNFDHLANVNKERQFLVANESLGYFYPLRIVTPMEVMGYERPR